MTQNVQGSFSTSDGDVHPADIRYVTNKGDVWTSTDGGYNNDILLLALEPIDSAKGDSFHHVCPKFGGKLSKEFLLLTIVHGDNTNAIAEINIAEIGTKAAKEKDRETSL